MKEDKKEEKNEPEFGQIMLIGFNGELVELRVYVPDPTEMVHDDYIFIRLNKEQVNTVIHLSKLMI